MAAKNPKKTKTDARKVSGGTRGSQQDDNEITSRARAAVAIGRSQLSELAGGRSAGDLATPERRRDTVSEDGPDRGGDSTQPSRPTSRR